MIYRVYCIYDSVTRNYHLPFYQRRDEEAIRSFDDARDDPANPSSKHPQDYSLFFIGTYDDDNGQMTSPSPERIR